MKLKRRILNIFAAIVMVFGSTPMTFLSAYADDGGLGSVPNNMKSVKANRNENNEPDGTYDITLTIEGASKEKPEVTKANVVVVLDTSSSMNGNRLTVAKSAVNTLATELLGQNDPNDSNTSDMVQVAFLDFAKTVRHQYLTPTTDLDTFKGWVNPLTTEKGTNWEDALRVANSVTFGDSDKTYIIFVSDGDPSYRISQYSSTARDCANYQGVGPDRVCTLWGTGNSYDDREGWNYGAAKQYVDDYILTATNKEFYTIGAFGDTVRMKNLGGTYYDATDENALKNAFDDIVNKIMMGLSVGDLHISDGITQATSAEIKGTAGNFRYDVPTEWGNDWARATFENGTVHWNPGRNKTLKNSQSASVTFTVWPSQAAMDCIAAIRNGTGCSIADADLASYGLGKNADGSFKLLTNTTASFTYSTVTTNPETNEQTFSPATEATFDEDRDDTTLPETRLKVSKIWDDGLDPKQRKDIGEVSVDLFVDRETHPERVKHYVFNQTSESSNEWDGPNVTENYTYAVAPGVMKKLTGLPSEQAANLRAVALAAGPDRIVTVNGKEYAILEMGHDYEFDNESYTLNPNGSVHYHITKKSYHPMIVDDGQIHDVEFDWDNKTATINSMALTSLSVENTLNGGILVSKVVNNNGEIDKNIDDKFTITVYDIKDKDGHLLSNTDTTPRLYRIQTFEGMVEENGEMVEKWTSGPKKPYTNGKITESITVNQRIMVTDVPTGTTYKVKETLPKGYTENSYTYQRVQYSTSGSQTIPEDEDDPHVVNGNASSQAIVTNYIKSGDLVVSKTVTSTKEQYLANARTKEFNFTVNVYEHQGDETPFFTDTFVLKHGSDPYVVEDLPVDYYYEVIEEAKPGFTATSGAKITGTIAQGEKNNKVKFTNRYDVKPLEGKDAEIIANKKFVEGREQFWKDDKFTFIMYGNGESVESEPITRMGDENNGSYTFKVNIADAGKYTYTITEKEEDDEGNSLFRDGVSRLGGDEDIVVKIEVEDNGEGGLRLVSKTYEKGKKTIFNTYEATGTLGKGKTENALKFEKVLEGRDWEDFDKFTFTLTTQDEDAPMPESGKTTATVKKTDDENFAVFKFGEIKYTTDDVGKTYSYLVTETFDESIMKNVKQSEDTVNGISILVTVSDNEDGTLNLTVASDHEHVFTNIYTPDETTTDESDLTKDLFDIVKMVEDEYERFDGEEFSFTIESDDFETRTLKVETASEGVAEISEPYVFTKARDYTFTVKETPGDNPEISYDDTVYTVVIKVVDNVEKGKLEIKSVTVNGKKSNGESLTFTNIYTPIFSEYKVKKIWKQDSSLDLPEFIVVELLADGEVVDTVTVFPGEDNDWSHTFTELYQYNEEGKEIEYSVREKSIDGASEGTFIVYDGDAILGQWIATIEGAEITNTWTEAKNEYEYDGKTEFMIKKKNEDGEALAGVKFKVNSKEYVTDANGKIKIKVPVKVDANDDELKFSIKESEALEGYERVIGKAEIAVVCKVELVSVDEETLTNQYVKNCKFSKSGSEKFSWDEPKLRLTVVNNKVPVDPCAKGGCGGEVVPEPEPEEPEAPVTGRITRMTGAYAESTNLVAAVAGISASIIVLFSVVRRKEHT